MITCTFVIREVGQNAVAFEARHSNSNATPWELAIITRIDGAVAEVLSGIQKTCGQSAIIIDGTVAPESIVNSNIDDVFRKHGKPA